MLPRRIKYVKRSIAAGPILNNLIAEYKAPAMNKKYFVLEIDL
jgi:hypothetical protein